MSVKNSGSFNSDINNLSELVLREPQKLWRNSTEAILRDIVDTYYARAVGNVHLINNVSVTAINSADEYSEISGTYIVDLNNINFIGTTDGFLTYSGEITKRFMVFSTMHKNIDGGGTQRTAQRIYVNDTPISSSRMTADIRNVIGESSVLIDSAQLEPGDVLHIEVTNLDDDGDIIVDTHHFKAHSIH